MISYVRLEHQAEEEADALAQIFREVSLSGKYIGGHYVEKLEHELAALSPSGVSCYTKFWN